MSLSEFDLVGLIGLVYEAAENPTLWPQFLESYAGVFGADLAFVQRRRLVLPTSAMIASFGFSSRLQASDNEHHSRLNVRQDRGRPHDVQGRVVLDEQMSPRSDLVKSEFYNDYLVPIGAIHCAAGVVAREENDFVTLAVMRARERPPFGETERRALQALLPHVTRAQAIGARLQMLDASESILDTLDVALVFVTCTAEVIHCSSAAETIVASADGFSIKGGRFCATEPRIDAQLREGIRAAVSSGRAIDSPVTLAIDRPSEKRPYRLLMAPLRQGSPSFTGMRQPEVVLLILDPESQRPAATDVLRQVFGLTHREATLAALLSTGKPLNEAAEELAMAYETARSHLRRIFDKTGTSRQTELMMLLGRLPKD